MPLRALFLALLSLFIAPLSLAADEDHRFDDKLVAEANRLIEKGFKDEAAYEIIESLTTEIGPRMAGSEQEARARDWAVKRLKKMGFKNIRVEPFEVDRWVRRSESAAIVSPFPQPLVITALGGSVPTPKGGVTGDVVRFESFADFLDSPLTGYEGKIIFIDETMTRSQDGSGYSVAVRKRRTTANEAAKRGAAAALIRSVGTSSHRFAHTGSTRFSAETPRVPFAALSAPDADQLARALRHGPVSVHIELDVESLGPVQSGNVIAEIPGRTDELVVIGGHLDSWDLGTGAVDDGAGVGITMAAAHLVKKMNRKPKRTIRLILWGSEEVGLVGARAYAEAHKDELDKHFIASESDFGGGKIWRISTNFAEDKLGYAAAFRHLFARFTLAEGNNQTSGGPDIIPLSAMGVPAFRLDQDGTDYFDLHHTANDTFDKIKLEDIQQNVALWSAFIWVAANMEGDLRSDSPAEETVETQ